MFPIVVAVSVVSVCSGSMPRTLRLCICDVVGPSITAPAYITSILVSVIKSATRIICMEELVISNSCGDSVTRVARVTGYYFNPNSEMHQNF